MYVFANILNPINTGSGLAEKIFIAPVSWFTKTGIKSPGDWITKGDEVVIKDTHEFLPGKAFFECLLAPEKNNYDAKNTGDTGFTRFDNEIKVMLPGSYELQHEMIKNILNEPCIVLIKDSNCAANIWYQVGNACTYAYLSADFETGTTREGTKDYLLTIRNSAGYILLYAGDIDTIDEVTINPIVTEDNFNFITEDDQVIINEN